MLCVYSSHATGTGMGSLEPLRGAAPFANGGGGGYDRYENGYSRSLNGPGVSAGPASYHDQVPYERYPTERFVCAYTISITVSFYLLIFTTLMW